MINNIDLEIITLDKKNISNFALERNKLLKKTKSSWILFLDKDEKLTPRLEYEIEKEINNSKTKFKGYYLKRKIVFLGRVVGEDKVLRLARKGVGIWKRAVHETWQIKGSTKTLNNYIIHTTATSLKEYISKINFHSDLHALENKKEGKKASICKMIIYPTLKLIYNLILGRGFVFSLLQSLHSFLSWTKLYFLQH